MGVVKHNCGLCVAHTLHDVYSFIKSLQHRGREAAGIAFIGQNRIDVLKWQGSIDKFDIDDLYKIFPSEKYHTYLAHVRYATRGRKDKILQDAHPHVIGGKIEKRDNHILITDCDAVIVHNGQVKIKDIGIDNSKLKTGSDTEALLHYFINNGPEKTIEKIPGSYTVALAVKWHSAVYVFRDRYGIRPGCLGWKDGKHVIASEDIAFKKNGAKFIEDLEPGYVYYLLPEGHYKRKKVCSNNKKHCFFEYNYISNVGTESNGVNVRRIRELLGEELAKEHLIKADFVSFLPRCPEVAARSYAEKAKLPFVYVFYKTRSERSFLGSTSEDRKNSIKQNLYLNPKINGKNTIDLLNGKSIVLIDDSTIRGNNSKRAIELLKQAGASQIYLVNYTPKIGIIGKDNIPRGCTLGVDMPPDDNFIARQRNKQEIDERIGADVRFLSIQGMLNAFEKAGLKKEDLCLFCIGGEKAF
jgi:amidophosphoribosyltransferase